MSTAFESPAESPAGAAPAAATLQRASRGVLVWDAPVRLFHWLTVLSFAGAYLTAESERWRLVHVTLGYTMAGLVAFRVLWGFIGTRHARFSDFVRGPSAVVAYLKSLRGPKPEHHAGHNPAGGWAIVALLALAGGVTATGWATYNDWGGEWLEEAHEAVVNVMIALIAVHVAAVVLSSRLHRENLVLAMFTGRKAGAPSDAIRRAWSAVAALMLAAVLGFWWLQWRDAPAPGATPAGAMQRHGSDHDDD